MWRSFGENAAGLALRHCRPSIGIAVAKVIVLLGWRLCTAALCIKAAAETLWCRDSICQSLCPVDAVLQLLPSTQMAYPGSILTGWAGRGRRGVSTVEVSRPEPLCYRVGADMAVCRRTGQFPSQPAFLDQAHWPVPNAANSS
eukprot:366158-Chlamydomonas_euryale.AAC.2